MLWWTLRQLKSKDFAVRLMAIRKLGESKNPRAVKPLIAALKDDDEDVREAAEGALERIDPNWTKSETAKEAVPTFIEGLKDTSSAVREVAAERLGRIGGARALEALVGALEDDSSGVRKAVEKGLERIDPDWTKSETAKEAVPTFIEGLKDTSSAVREAAAEGLGRINDRRAFDPLLGALKDEVRDVRKAAVEALSRINDRRAFDALLGALEDADREVRRAAARALDQIEPHWRSTQGTLLLSVIAIHQSEHSVVLEATDEEDRSHDLRDVNLSAVLFVPRGMVQHLQNDPTIWERVTNPEAAQKPASPLRSADGMVNLMLGVLANMDGPTADLLPGELRIELVDSYRDAKMKVDFGATFKRNLGEQDSA